jgi:hypothetical protein
MSKQDSGEGFVIGGNEEEKVESGCTSLILDSQGNPVEKTLEEMIMGSSGVDLGEMSQQHAMTVFLVDCSGSMNAYLDSGAWDPNLGRYTGRTAQSKTKLELMKKMVYKYIKNRFARNENSRLGLVKFESYADIIVEICSDEDELLSMVQGLQSGGSTQMAAGLRASIGLLKKAHGLGIPRIVLISDGVADSREDVIQAIEEEKDYVLTIDSIYIGREADHVWLEFMEKLAKITGGTFEKIENEQEFETKFLKAVNHPLLTSGRLGNALLEDK